VTGTDAGAPFHRIEELEQENEVLRERLRQKQAELERADAEIDRLRQGRSRIFLLGAAGEQEENGLGASASGPARNP
jgi:hypothetical protein